MVVIVLLCTHHSSGRIDLEELINNILLVHRLNNTPIAYSLYKCIFYYIQL